MSTITTTTNAFVLVDQYGQSTRRYQGAAYGHGIVSLELFETEEQALAELKRWMNEAANALEYTEDEFKTLYTEYYEELDEDETVLTYNEWLAANFPKGAGYYDLDTNFLGGFDDRSFDHGDNEYSVHQAQVVEESPSEPIGTVADEITKTITFRGYSIKVDRWGDAV